MQKSGETVEFIYNENGLRMQKTATSTGVTKYTLHGKNVVHMTQGSNELHFFYDAQNKPAVVVFNGTPYSYVKNLQGDIIAILDSNKNVVVSYVYDAWGRPISKTGSMAATLGTVQPFRYRGYVYDEEIGLYYLKSRYYNPAMSRFFNPDATVSTGQGILGQNMYVYCLNEPPSMVDKDGHIGLFALCAIGAGLNALFTYASDVIDNYRNGYRGVDAWWNEVNKGEVVAAAVSGAISAIPGTPILGDLGDAVLSNTIEEVVNWAFGEEFVLLDIVEETIEDWVTSSIMSDFFPTRKVPEFIRDIKREAREQGIKGTNALLQYLGGAQVRTVIDNTLTSQYSDAIKDEMTSHGSLMGIDIRPRR